MNKHEWSASITATCTDPGVIMDAFVKFAEALDGDQDSIEEYDIALLDSAGNTVLSFAEKYEEDQ